MTTIEEHNAFTHSHEGRLRLQVRGVRTDYITRGILLRTGRIHHWITHSICTHPNDCRCHSVLPNLYARVFRLHKDMRVCSPNKLVRAQSMLEGFVYIGFNASFELVFL